MVDEVRRSGDTGTVEVQVRTEQEGRFGRDGETCSDWSRTRTMNLVGDTWLTDRVENTAGSPAAC